MTETVLAINVCQAREAVLPLGILSVIASLREAGWEVEFLDYQLARVGSSGWSPRELEAAIPGSAHTLAFSCMYDSLPLVLLTCARLKQRNPECRIVLGGPGPSVVAEAIAQKTGWVDCVVAGPGETIVPAVLKSGFVHTYEWPDGWTAQDVRGGLVLRREYNGLWRSEVRVPDYGLIEVSRYAKCGIVLARGCPYDCCFCSAARIWGRRVVGMNQGDVFRNVTHLAQNGFRHVDVWDDTFGLDAGVAASFCNHMAQQHPAMSWTCNLRVESANRRLLENLAGTGCSGVFFGVESGSDMVLARMGKRHGVAQALPALKTAREVVGDVSASFIWGFPWESREEFLLTLGFMAHLTEVGVEVRHSRLAPIPGTPVFDDYRERLMRPTEKDLRYSLLASVTGVIDAEILGFIEQEPEICAGFYVCDSPVLDIAYEVLPTFHECVF